MEAGMASLKDAEQARAESADLLRDLGAHAISVESDQDVSIEPVASLTEPAASPTKAAASSTKAVASQTKAPGKTKPASRRRPRWSVVAWFDGDPPESVPSEIQVAHRRGSAAVPVKIRRSEQFQPEPASGEPESDVLRPE
jgi:hypothetical protein